MTLRLGRTAKHTLKASDSLANTLPTVERQNRKISFELAPGTIIAERYRIGEQIGEGGMGQVWLAQDTRLERPAAVKFLSETAVGAHDQYTLSERFRMEAIAMARVRHDNVVQVFDLSSYEDRPLIVMEYVPGPTVRELLTGEGGALFLDVAVGILRQAAAGLDVVHRHGFVHRDIKPGNMLIGPNYRVVIADFGLAELAQAANPGQASLVGTPAYMAPELITLDRVPGHQRHLADVYALGVCAFEMLTGERPYQGANINAVLNKHITEDVPLVSDIRGDLPLAFDQVLSLALAKDPKRRFRSCSAFIEALDSARPDYQTDSLKTDPQALFIDNDPEVVSLYQLAFEVATPDAECSHCTDGLIALELAKSRCPNLIIADSDIPGFDGYGFIRGLRAAGILDTSAVVIVSAEWNETLRSEFLRLGVNDCLKKPLTPRQLGSIARTYLTT